AGELEHDFNNMLSVILGYCDILQSDISPESPLFSAVEEITNAANRSAELTRQLLTFSRKQAVAPRAINLTEHLRGMERLLKRTIGEDVQLEFIFPPDLWEVFMDPSQIDQIAANLAVNSRDAMPNGGKLTIETRNVTLGTEFGQVYDDFHPGDYVILNVNDTGCGMTKETLEHIFEPFFTTKGEGKGTGLGMATVYGVVHQNNGLVKIYSEPGYGTAVSIYLPRYQDLRQAESAIAPPPEAKVHFGTETILLVEDEAQLRQLILRQLKSLGYEVLEASLPNEALALCDKYTNRIDLLLTDIIMPGGMNGQELSKKIQEMRSDIHILFMSGYTADTIAQHGVLNSDVHFLQKPFSKEALANKLRKALNN
ncbi:TPA: histidine kinase, partial [Candidatus Sumerlaeota bacterium]|nr:histidine kinase [Candidatus Sumerlaeota bacterium]